MANESVREGMSTSRDADEVFYFTDYITVLHTYKALKEESEEIPELLPKMDLTEIAEPHYEAMDDFMHGILDQFEIWIQQTKTRCYQCYRGSQPVWLHDAQSSHQEGHRQHSN